jgi:hypothetical protein
MLENRTGLASYFEDPGTGAETDATLAGEFLENYMYRGKERGQSVYDYYPPESDPSQLPDGMQFHRHGREWKAGEWGKPKTQDERRAFARDRSEWFQESGNIDPRDSQKAIHTPGTPWAKDQFGFVPEHIRAAKAAHVKAMRTQRNAARAQKNKKLHEEISEHQKKSFEIYTRNPEWDTDIFDVMTVIQANIEQQIAGKNTRLKTAMSKIPTGASKEQKREIMVGFYAHKVNFDLGNWAQIHSRIATYLKKTNTFDRLGTRFPPNTENKWYYAHNTENHAHITTDHQNFYLYSTVYLKYLTALKALIMDATLDKYGKATTGDEKAFADHSKKAKRLINDLKVKPGKAPKWRPDAISLNMWNDLVLRGKYEAWKHRSSSNPNAKVPKKLRRFAPDYVPPVQNAPGTRQSKARRPRGSPWWQREPRQRPAPGNDVPPLPPPRGESPPPRANNRGESPPTRPVQRTYRWPPDGVPKEGPIPYDQKPSFVRPARNPAQRSRYSVEEGMAEEMDEHWW